MSLTDDTDYYKIGYFLDGSMFHRFELLQSYR